MSTNTPLDAGFNESNKHNIVPLEVQFNIKQQEKYSKGQAVLRYLFGFFYIGIPHFFVLMFVGIAANFITFIAWWAILFTGKYPKSLFDFQVNFIRWNMRLTMRFWHMSDGYPAFGLSKVDPNLDLNIVYPEKLSRGNLLIKSFFGFFLAMPHIFCLYFRFIGSFFFVFLNFWSILFSGNYNPKWHAFNESTLRWMLRLQAYLLFLRDEYPPFNGKPEYERLDLKTQENGTIVPQEVYFNIKQQEKYSKGQAVLRYLFGFFYIGIPHFFVLMFVGIAANFITFIAWWAILFTGKYPKSLFDFQVNFIRWNMRLTMRFWHMSDGYPAFGLSKVDPNLDLNIVYPEKLSRGNLLIKSFFGFFLAMPHIFCLYFRFIGSFFFVFLNFWSILFSGNYNPKWHAFNESTLRWMLRLQAYLLFLRDEYPPFNGKPIYQRLDLQGGLLPLAGTSMSSEPVIEKAGSVSSPASSSANIVTDEAGNQFEVKQKTVLVRKPDGSIVKKVVEEKVPVNPTFASAVEKSSPKPPEAEKITPKTQQATSQQKITPSNTKTTANTEKKEEKSNSKMALIFAILAGLFLVGFILIYWSFYNLNEKMLSVISERETNYENYQDTIASLRDQVEALNLEAISLRDQLDNPEKNEKLKSMMTEYDALKSRLNQLQKMGTGGNVNVSKYKKEIEELKQRISSLEEEIRAYQEKIKALENDKLNLVAEADREKKNAEAFKNQSKKLEQQIDEASKIDFEDIIAGGIKFKTDDKKKDAPKAKKLNRIQVCFSMAANKLAKPGNREIFVKITAPDGSVLSRGDQTTTINGEEIKYTLSKSQNYSNKEELVCMYYERNDDKLPTGAYLAEIYAEDRKVGETSFILK